MNQAKVFSIVTEEGTLKCCRNPQVTNAEYKRKTGVKNAQESTAAVQSSADIEGPAASGSSTTVGSPVRRARPTTKSARTRPDNTGPCLAHAFPAQSSGDPHPSGGATLSGRSSRGRPPRLPGGSYAQLHLQPMAHPHHPGPAQGHMQIQRIAAFGTRNLAEDAHIQSARNGRLRAGHANRLRRGPAQGRIRPHEVGHEPLPRLRRP